MKYVLMAFNKNSFRQNIFLCIYVMALVDSFHISCYCFVYGKISNINSFHYFIKR